MPTEEALCPAGQGAPPREDAFAVPFMASVPLYAEGSHFEERVRRDPRRTFRLILSLLGLGILLVWF